MVDDLIVYKVRDNCYFIVVNAANKDKDYAWMKTHVTGDAELSDISASVAQLALQGPKAMDILRKLAKEEDIPEKYYTCKFHCTIDGMDCIISKTGYTGEDGVEIYLASGDAPRLWRLLMENGRDEGLIPCGLGARDTLPPGGLPCPCTATRWTIPSPPRRPGLGCSSRWIKRTFIGKKAIEARGPLTRRRVGLKVTGRGIVRGTPARVRRRQTDRRHHFRHPLPYLGYPVAMALLDIAYKEPGTAVEVDVRGRRVAAEVIKLPFYKRS